MIILRKSYMLLLEVLIAMVLVVLCLLPLIQPNVQILAEQKKIIKKIELNQLVNLLYLDVQERLHNNEISWKTIEEAKPVEIDWSKLQLKQEPSYLKGTYAFKTEKVKLNETTGWACYIITVTFSFPHFDQKKEQDFPFTFFLMRHAPMSKEPDVHT